MLIEFKDLGGLKQQSEDRQISLGPSVDIFSINASFSSFLQKLSIIIFTASFYFMRT